MRALLDYTGGMIYHKKVKKIGKNIIIITVKDMLRYLSRTNRPYTRLWRILLAATGFRMTR